MPPIVSTDWRRCIFPPNQLFLYFTTTKVIEKASNYKVLFNNVYRLAAAPLNCCKLRATRLELTFGTGIWCYCLEFEETQALMGATRLASGKDAAIIQ